MGIVILIAGFLLFCGVTAYMFTKDGGKDAPKFTCGGNCAHCGFNATCTDDKKTANEQ